jgi:hypothetical protein
MDRRWLENKRGNTIIMVALFLVVLMYSERAKLVTAVDAAALAGALKIPDEIAAISKASDYLDRNVNSPEKVTRNISMEDFPNYNKVVTVKAVQNTGLFLARVIGFSFTDIGAIAKAARVPVKGITGVLPIGITNNNWSNLSANYDNYKNADDSITLKVISNNKDKGFDTEKGNFFALDLNYNTDDKGGGADVYRTYIAYGYSRPLYLDDVRATETGNMVGPTNQGLYSNKNPTGRLVGNSCTIDPITKTIIHKCGCQDRDCPRVAYVPVFEPVDGDLSGKTDVRIVGFLPFFIIDANNQGEVSGVFLDDVMSDGIPGDYTTPDYGVHAVRLIE